MNQGSRLDQIRLVLVIRCDVINVIVRKVRTGCMIAEVVDFSSVNPCMCRLKRKDDGVVQSRGGLFRWECMLVSEVGLGYFFTVWGPWYDLSRRWR